MNPEILPVLDEISAVLKKHDMTGIFIVGNKSHVDWRVELSATWSCANIEKSPSGASFLRVRSNRGDYPSKEAQHECLQTTVGTFVSFNDTLKTIMENMDNVLITIAKHVEFTGKSTDES